MAGSPKSVRVDEELLQQLAQLARQRLVPETFAGQVDAGLRLLVRHAQDQQVRRNAELIAADRERAQRAYRQLRGRKR